MTFDTSNQLLDGIVLAIAAPTLGMMGWQGWKLFKRTMTWFARKIIIEPVKTGINEVIDDRVDERLAEATESLVGVTDSLVTQGVQLEHLHKCIEDRTEEIVKAHEAAQARVEQFMDETRSGGDAIVTYGAAERERIWAAIEALGGTRPEASVREATSK